MADDAPPPFDPNAATTAVDSAPPFNPNASSQADDAPPPFDPNAPTSEVPTDILPAMGQEASETWNTIKQGYGPSNAETYQKEASEAPFWDMTPTLHYYKRLGAALLASVGSPFQAIGMAGAAGAAKADQYLFGGYDPQKLQAAIAAGKPKDQALAEAKETPAQSYRRWRGNVDLAMAAIPATKPAAVPAGAPPAPPKPGPFGVTLSEGEQQADLAKRIREQAFIREGTDPHAQAWREQRAAQLEAAPGQAAEKFDPFNQTIVDSSQEASDVLSNALNRQQTSIDNLIQTSERNLGADHETLRQSLTPSNTTIASSPMEAADIISGAVSNESERAQEAIDQAYEELRNLPGQFHPAAFNKVGDKMRARLADDVDLGAINAQTTPQADSSLNYLDDVLSGVKQKRDPETGQILPKPPVTAEVVETARKRLNSFYGSALQTARATNNWSDVNAMRKVLNLFDGQVADRLKKGTFTGGDPTAVIDTMENARQIYSNYRKTFTPQGAGDSVGRDIQAIIGRQDGQAATPEQVTNMMFGKGQRPVFIARRLKQMFGVDSPEIGAAKQGLYSYITERPPGAAAWGPEKVADRIDEFTQGPGKTLAQEYLSPDEISRMQQLGARLRAHAQGVEAAKNPFAGVDFQAEFRKAIAGNQDSVDLLGQAFDRLGGHSSPFGVALKQGLFHHAIQPTENVAAWGPKKVGDNLYRLLASTRNSQIYSPADRQVIESYAKLMRQIEMPRDLYAPSAPAIQRAMSLVGYRLGQLIGAIAFRHIPGAPPIVSEFAGITIGGKLEKAAEAKFLGRVKNQLPLVSDQIARYQKAMAAYNRTQNPGTQRLVGIAAANLTHSLEDLGISPSYLQLPGSSPAQEDQSKKRAFGGAVNRDDGGGVQYTQPFPEAPGGYPFLTSDPTSAQLEPAGGDQPVDQPVDQLVTPEHRSIVDQLFGLTGPRYQLWPERMIRSGSILAGDVVSGQEPDYIGLRREDFTDVPGDTQPPDQMILRSQDMAGMAGGAGMGSAEEGAVGMAGGKLPPGWKTIQGGAENVAASQKLVEYAGITPERWFQLNPIDRQLIADGYEAHQALQDFHGNFMDTVRDRAQQAAQLAQQYHEEGKLPFPVGSRFTTQHSRQNDLLPFEVKGHFVDQKNPDHYGYLVERGQPGEDGWERTRIDVNNPKRPQIADLSKQFQLLSGPRSLGTLYSETNRVGAPLSALEQRGLAQTGLKSVPPDWRPSMVQPGEGGQPFIFHQNPAYRGSGELQYHRTNIDDLGGVLEEGIPGEHVNPTSAATLKQNAPHYGPDDAVVLYSGKPNADVAPSNIAGVMYPRSALMSESGRVGAPLSALEKYPIANQVSKSRDLVPLDFKEPAYGDGARGWIFPNGKAMEFDPRGDLNHTDIVRDETGGKYTHDNLMYEGTGRLVYLPRNNEVSYDALRPPTPAQVAALRRAVLAHPTTKLYIDKRGGGYEGGPAKSAESTISDRPLTSNDVNKLIEKVWPELKGTLLTDSGKPGAALSALEKLDKYGLNESQQDMMWGWKSGVDYDRLRKDPQFTKVLKKFPTHEGTVYRGLTLLPSELNKLKPGSIFSVDKHSSATTNRGIANSFTDTTARKRAVRLEITQSSGRKIPRMYNTAGSGPEAEVVLPRGAKYKIMAVRRVPGEEYGPNSTADLYVVKMKEQ